MSNDNGIFGRPDDSSRRQGSSNSGWGNEDENSEVRIPPHLQLHLPRRKTAGEHLSEGNLGGALAEGLRSLFTDK